MHKAEQTNFIKTTDTKDDSFVWNKAQQELHTAEYGRLPEKAIAHQAGCLAK